MRTRLIESNSPTAHGPLTPQQTAQLATQSEQAQTVTISDAAIAQTKSIKEQHAASLMSDPAIIGVGVSASLDSPGDPALMIYVLKGKAHGAIPATIDGVRTRIKETGPFRANVAHPLKSATAAAGCRVPKTGPATTLNAVPAALQRKPGAKSQRRSNSSHTDAALGCKAKFGARRRRLLRFSGATGRNARRRSARRHDSYRSAILTMRLAPSRHSNILSCFSRPATSISE